MRHTSTHIAPSWLPRLLCLAALLLASTACSSEGGAPGPGGGDDDDDDGPIEPPPDDFDYIYPPVAYTGFDGSATFKVPLATNLTENVTWELEDPTLATFEVVPAPERYADFGEAWIMLTTTKAGMTRVIATSGDRRAEAMLIVTQYDAAQVATGGTRYNEPADAGMPGRAACASCHQQPTGVDHSPLEMAFFADDELLSAITTGRYPDGYVLEVEHSWNLTDAERPAIVPYLRSLAPQGF